MVGVAWARDPPRTRAAGLLFARIDLASAIRIGSGIERVLQHILQGHAVGPTPLQRPLAGPSRRRTPSWMSCCTR